MKDKLRQDASHLARLKQQMLQDDEVSAAAPIWGIGCVDVGQSPGGTYGAICHTAAFECNARDSVTRTTDTQHRIPTPQAYRKDQTTVKRIQGALKNAVSWGDASNTVYSGDQLGAAAANGTSALFAALHRGGLKDWVLGRTSSGQPAAAAWKLPAQSGDPLLITQHAEEGEVRELVQQQQPSPAEHQDSEGPLSRSLLVQRQRTAAAAEATQLVGRALDQVPEGDREGIGESAAWCAQGWGVGCGGGGGDAVGFKKPSCRHLLTDGSSWTFIPFF